MSAPPVLIWLDYAGVAIALVAAALAWWRRNRLARQMAEWVRETRPEAWRALPPAARRLYWAGVRSLVADRRISGPEVTRYRTRDARLQQLIWGALIVAAVLLAFGYALAPA